MAHAKKHIEVVEKVTVVLTMTVDEAARLTALLGTFGSESPVSCEAGPNLYKTLYRVLEETGHTEQYRKYLSESGKAILIRSRRMVPRTTTECE